MSGRIMSGSSCSRMWQCHTYSLPPVRGLGGMGNGAVGRSNRMIIVVTSPGFIRLGMALHMPTAYGGISQWARTFVPGLETGEVADGFSGALASAFVTAGIPPNVACGSRRREPDLRGRAVAAL